MKRAHSRQPKQYVFFFIRLQLSTASQEEIKTKSMLLRTANNYQNKAFVASEWVPILAISPCNIVPSTTFTIHRNFLNVSYFVPKRKNGLKRVWLFPLGQLPFEETTWNLGVCIQLYELFLPLYSPCSLYFFPVNWSLFERENPYKNEKMWRMFTWWEFFAGQFNLRGYFRTLSVKYLY